MATYKYGTETKPKELVSFKELLIANSIQVDVFCQLLLDKGFFTEAEYFNKLKEVQLDYQRKQSQ